MATLMTQEPQLVPAMVLPITFVFAVLSMVLMIPICVALCKQPLKSIKRVFKRVLLTGEPYLTVEEFKP